MEYTELADYPVPAGTVTEWTPVSDPARWPVDHRPAGPNHEAHLRERVGCAAGANEWIGGIWRLPHRFDEAAFRRTLLAWIARHEVLRSEVTVDADGTLTRRTAPATAIDVRADRLRGGPRSGHRAYQHLKDHFDSRVRADAWPHCLLATIEPTDDPTGFTVVFGADHSVMDAYSQLLAICEITLLYTAELSGAPHGLPDAGSQLEHALVEAQQVAGVGADHPAVAAWRRFTDAGDARFPLPLCDGASAVNQRPVQSSLATWLLGPEQTAALDRRIKSAGGKFQPAVIAALALAQARLSGERRLRFVMPMHTRTEARWAFATGWFVGLMPVDLELPAAALRAAGDTTAALAAALPATAAALGAYRGLEHVPYPTVARHLGLGAPRFVVSYVDGRFTPGVEQWADWRARVLRSESTAGDELYFWLGRTPRGLNLSTRFPSNPVAAETVYSVIAELREILTAAAGPDPAGPPAAVAPNADPAPSAPETEPARASA